MNTATLDIDKLASACGIKKSRAIAGGIYLCNDESLRAFASAIASQFNLDRDDDLDAVPLSRQHEELSAYAAD